MRKKFMMENQRKKLESRKFFEKKIRKQGTFKRKNRKKNVRTNLKKMKRKFFTSKIKNLE